MEINKLKLIWLYIVSYFKVSFYSTNFDIISIVFKLYSRINILILYPALQKTIGLCNVSCNLIKESRFF